MEMETLFTFVYVWMILAGIVMGIQTGSPINSAGEGWAIGFVAGIFMTPFIILMFYAGIFYHVTGYAGDVWYLNLYAVVSLVTTLFTMVFHQRIKSAYFAISLMSQWFVFYMMNGLTQWTGI